MKIIFEVDNKTIVALVYGYIKAKLGDEANVQLENIKIDVQSKQNYRIHEWERGELRVKYEGEI